jgi:hypothetical protein
MEGSLTHQFCQPEQPAVWPMQRPARAGWWVEAPLSARSGGRGPGEGFRHRRASTYDLGSAMPCGLPPPHTGAEAIVTVLLA